MFTQLVENALRPYFHTGYFEKFFFLKKSNKLFLLFYPQKMPSADKGL